jgi:outer membrane protein TolC
MKKRRYITIILLSLTILVGCSKTQEDMMQVRFENYQKDLQKLYSAVRLPARPLVLEDFIAFALNRNLDLVNLKQEYEIQQEISTGQKLAMLPSLSINGDWSQRSNERGTVSKSLLTGITSTSVSDERRSNKRDISFVWNLIDFGLSYYRARQEDNKAFISQERFKRLRQNLILDVIQSYWKSIIAQKAVEGAESIVTMARHRQKNLKRQIERQVISEIEGLENEERLIEMQIRLQTFQSDLQSAKAELSSLLGLAPGSDFAIKNVILNSPVIKEFEIAELEKDALTYRPELYIQDLEEKIASDEVKAAMVSMFPNASLFGNYNYDRNRFLLNKDWATMGVRAAWNLLALPRHIINKRVSKMRMELKAQSRISLSIGVLTQVHLSYISYLNAHSQYKLAKDLYAIKSRLLRAVQKGEQVGEFGGAELLKLEAETLFSKINALTAYAEMQISLERINNAIGKPFHHNENIDIQAVEQSKLGLEEEVKEEIKEVEVEIEEQEDDIEAAGDKTEKEEVPVPIVEEKAIRRESTDDEEVKEEVKEEEEEEEEEGEYADEIFEEESSGADEDFEQFEENKSKRRDIKHPFQNEDLLIQKGKESPGEEEKEYHNENNNLIVLRRREKVFEILSRRYPLIRDLDDLWHENNDKKNPQEILGYVGEDSADELWDDALLEKRYRKEEKKDIDPVFVLEEDYADEFVSADIERKILEAKSSRIALRQAGEEVNDGKGGESLLAKIYHKIKDIFTRNDNSLSEDEDISQEPYDVPREDLSAADKEDYDKKRKG